MKPSIGWTLALTVAVTALIAAPTAARAQGPAVTQVLIVNVEPMNVDAYMAFVKRAQAIVKDLGLPEFQVLRATMAGDNTGALAIVIENESLAALAANQGKSQGSAQWQKMISDIQKAGISRIVSNSLWIDVTPK
jgi:uncharacterized protein YbjT (DUF2867 family)